MRIGGLPCDYGFAQGPGVPQGWIVAIGELELLKMTFINLTHREDFHNMRNFFVVVFQKQFVLSLPKKRHHSPLRRFLCKETFDF